MIGVNECFNLLTLSNLGKLVRKLRLVYSPPHQKITRLNPFFVKFHGGHKKLSIVLSGLPLVI